MVFVNLRGGWFRSQSEDRVLEGWHRSGRLSVTLVFDGCYMHRLLILPRSLAFWPVADWMSLLRHSYGAPSVILLLSGHEERRQCVGHLHGETLC
jgi:hypothetical protein